MKREEEGGGRRRRQHTRPWLSCGGVPGATGRVPQLLPCTTLDRIVCVTLHALAHARTHVHTAGVAAED